MTWPEFEAVIESIRVDGDSNVHVFPYVAPSLAAETRPVDIYDWAGRLPHNAQAPSMLWEAAWKDFAYDVRESEVTGGYEIVRYRLVKPPLSGGVSSVG